MFMEEVFQYATRGRIQGIPFLSELSSEINFYMFRGFRSVSLIVSRAVLDSTRWYLVYLSPRIPSAARCGFQLELEVRLFNAIVIKAVEQARGLLVSIRLAIEICTF